MKLPKHHYIPVFYLKKWARPDGRIIEFSRPYGEQVKPRRTHPDGTGYIRGLYRLPGVVDAAAELIESRFMKAIDDAASYAQVKLLKHQISNWTADMRSAWSRFIIGVLIRSPKSLDDINSRMHEGFPRQWNELRERLLQETPESKPLGDYDPTAINRSSILSLQRFIDNPSVGQFINDMNWSVFDVSASKFRFLTSDRPIVMTNGLALPNGHLALPISSTVLFLATANIKMTQSIHAMPLKEVVWSCNKQVVRNAVKYVWASDESQSALIKKQMSLDAQHNRRFFGDPSEPLDIEPIAERLRLSQQFSR